MSDKQDFKQLSQLGGAAAWDIENARLIDQRMKAEMTEEMKKEKQLLEERIKTGVAKMFGLESQAQLSRLGEAVEVDENGLPTLRGSRGILPIATKEPVEKSWGLQHSGCVPGRVKRFEYLNIRFDNDDNRPFDCDPETPEALQTIETPYQDGYSSVIVFNRLGELGWEMCGVRPTPLTTHYYFKREIKDW